MNNDTPSGWVLNVEQLFPLIDANIQGFSFVVWTISGYQTCHDSSQQPEQTAKRAGQPADQTDYLQSLQTEGRTQQEQTWDLILQHFTVRGSTPQDYLTHCHTLRGFLKGNLTCNRCWHIQCHQILGHARKKINQITFLHHHFFPKSHTAQ